MNWFLALIVPMLAPISVAAQTPDRTDLSGPPAGAEATRLPEFLAPPTVGTPEAAPPSGLPCAPPCGVFVTLEGMLNTPHSTQLGFLGAGDNGLKLGWTVTPEVTLGYRTEGGHAFLASYRFLDVTGNSNPVGDPLMTETFHAAVQAHWLDLNYLSRCYNPWCSLGLQWETGLRMIYLRNHTQDTITSAGFFSPDLPPLPSFTQVTDIKTSLAVAGPHLGLDPSWAFGKTGLALVGRADLGVLVGGVDLTLTTDGVTDSFSATKAFLDTRLEAGVSWTAPWQRPWLRLAAGYRLDQIYLLGNVQGTVWLSRTFSDHGPFLRCEIAY